MITASITTVTDKDPLVLFPLQSLIFILAKGLKFGGKISFYQNLAHKLSEKQWNEMFGGVFLSWFISIQFHHRSCRSRKSKDAGSDCSIYISIAPTQLSLQEPSSKLTMWTDAFDNWWKSQSKGESAFLSPLHSTCLFRSYKALFAKYTISDQIVGYFLFTYSPAY